MFISHCLFAGQDTSKDCGSGRCVETTIGAKCSCPEGFYFDDSINNCTSKINIFSMGLSVCIID